MCDCRVINKSTLKNSFALPNPKQILDHFAGAKHLTKLDEIKGFHQIALSYEDSQKSTTTTMYGNCRFAVITFEFANAPSMFNKVMAGVLLDHHDRFFINYADATLYALNGWHSRKVG